LGESLDVFRCPTDALTPQEFAGFGVEFIPGMYTYADCKTGVVGVLQKSFDARDVKSSKKAVKIKDANRKNVDVVLVMEYRRYYSGLSRP
jgi:hypothetical protein